MDNILTLSIKELLNHNDKYIIPIYQRNYAWGETEIVQLIQDIIDSIPVKKSYENNYYLGTLVVFEDKKDYNVVYQTIDGQQRLTTLSLLACVIKNKYKEVNLDWFSKLNIDFESRKISSDTLQAVYLDEFNNYCEYNESILNGYSLIQKTLKIKLQENNIAIKYFCAYFMDRVKIIRVPVPKDTDLNHYFEIMNNRGEQLEKHEILKSKMLEILNQISSPKKESAFESFQLIWDACSNMEKYVQYGFNTEQRNILFKKSNWDNLNSVDFDDICVKLNLNNEGNGLNTVKISLSDIIARKTIQKLEEKDEDTPDRFNSVINFPNFLLHILRIQTKCDIPLDDKRLIKIFEDEITNSKDEIEFVKEFTFNLLKGRMLFDKYIIKREFIAGTDKWSLKKLKWYEGNKVSYVNTFIDENNKVDVDDNRCILMLLSMFHVSTPTMVYKHWLNAALKFVLNNSNITAIDYINYLESLAKAFLFDRFIAREPKDYYEIIYNNSGVNKNRIRDLDITKLRYGNISNNLVFNYLDYLLWKEQSSKDKIIKNYEFTFRSSVEHYYPQHPMPGFDKLDEDVLNSFGNLCLISHNKNSRLSNFMPTAKKEHYAQNNIDSIKQYLMMNDYESEKWNVACINDHYSKMTKQILKQLT